MPTNYIKVVSDWKPISQFWLKVSSNWKSITQGWINVAGSWKQFFGATNNYVFSFGNTVHIGTNGYISLDSGQSAISISSTVGRVLGILPADLELNSIRYAADSSKFYMFYRGKRLGGTNFEIEYEVHFTDGQDYALIKLVAFPSSTYSLTGYYVDGSSTGYSRITTTRTVGAEYRVYFDVTAAFATSFTEFGTASHPVWLAQSTLTSGNADDGYISIVANQGSSAQAPTSVTASSITGTSATVSWTAPTNANSGMSAIQSYDYSINGGSSWTSTSTSTSVNITGLSSGTSYTVLVRANNYYFTGTNYGSVTFSTLSNLTAPTIFFVSSGVEGGPVSVYFTGGSGPFYQMYWTTGTAPTTPVTPDASGSASPLTDNTGPGSTGFTWYAYVRSVATVGETSVGPSTVASVWSTGFAFTVAPANATPPTSVTATALSSSSVFVAWSGATNATKYRIWWSTGPSGNGVDPAVSFDAETTGTSFTFNTLNASTTYYFWVSASNTNNIWTSYSLSPRGQATTLSSTPSTPGTPTLTYIPANNTSTTWGYSATWAASSGSGTIQYQINALGSSGGTATLGLYSTNSASFNLSRTNNTWQVRVRATNNGGSTFSSYSSYSNSA
jgi:hypothetical protein